MRKKLIGLIYFLSLMGLINICFATSYKGYIGGDDINWWDGVLRTFDRRISTGGTITLNKIGEAVDVLEVYGNGDSYTSASIQTAISSVGTTNTVGLILQPGIWTISTATTIPSNITLIVPPGAILTKSGSGTLTINGPFDAGPYKIFSNFNTGVTFIAIEKVYPEWWGENTVPGTTDMTAEIQAASDSMTNPHIHFRGETYLVTTSLDFTNNNNGGYRGYMLSGEGTHASIILLQTNGAPGLDFTGTSYCVFEDFAIKGSSTNSPNVGLLFARQTGPSVSSGGHNLRNVTIYGHFTVSGLYLYGSETNSFIDCFLETETDTGYAVYNTGNNSASITSLYQTIPTTSQTSGYNTFVQTGLHQYASTYVQGRIMKIDGGAGNMMFLNCNFSMGGGDHAIDVTANSYGLFFIGGNLEGANSITDYFLYVTGGGSTSMGGVLFQNFGFDGTLQTAAIYGGDNVSWYGLNIEGIYATTIKLLDVWRLYDSFITAPHGNTAAGIVEIRNAAQRNIIKGLINAAGITFGGTNQYNFYQQGTAFYFKDIINTTQISISNPGSTAINVEGGATYLHELNFADTALDNTGTPSVDGKSFWTTGGTTAITAFADGAIGQIIIILALHNITITDGATIVLSGSANYAMNSGDTLMLINKANVWYEIGRSDNN